MPPRTPCLLELGFRPHGIEVARPAGTSVAILLVPGVVTQNAVASYTSTWGVANRRRKPLDGPSSVVEFVGSDLVPPMATEVAAVNARSDLGGLSVCS